MCWCLIGLIDKWGACTLVSPIYSPVSSSNRLAFVYWWRMTSLSDSLFLARGDVTTAFSAETYVVNLEIAHGVGIFWCLSMCQSSKYVHVNCRRSDWPRRHVCMCVLCVHSCVCVWFCTLVGCRECAIIELLSYLRAEKVFDI